MSRARTNARIKRESAAIAAQRKWIAEHGQTISGYVARYGSATDPEHYGDGGEAIYRADMDELARLVERP